MPSYEKSLSNSTVLEIQRMSNFRPKEYKVGDIVGGLFNSLARYYDTSKAVDTNKKIIEPQLLHSEFSNVKLFDAFGNFYNYLPNFIPQEENNTVMVHGAIADTNMTHWGIKNYNNVEDLNTEDYKSKYFSYGMMDMSNRSLTVITDSTEAYMQAHKNQVEAQRSSFNENKEMMDKQIDFSNRNVQMQNDQASYNANFALESTKLGVYQNVLGGAFGLVGNALSGNVGGVIQSGVGLGFGVIGGQMQIDNANMQKQFTEQRNSMNSEANTLNNMQAKLNYTQSLRSFNASLKDLDNQPSSIQSMGSDMTFVTGNGVNDVFLSWEIPLPYILKQANDFIRLYGVNQNVLYNDIRTIYKHRKDYNFIHCNNIHIPHVEMNINHKNVLETIFTSGVRVWNYTDNIDDNFLDFAIENPDL